MKKVLYALVLAIGLFGCAKDEITIYNDYSGTSSDSTGYYNIYYHDFEPDIILKKQYSVYHLDLNNDDLDDFGFGYSESNNMFYLNDVGQVIASIDCPGYEVANLEVGFYVQNTLDYNYYRYGSGESLIGCINTSGNGDILIGYMTGAAENGTYHNSTRNYGWLRLEVFGSGDSVILKDYAYNLIENSPIRVGDK